MAATQRIHRLLSRWKAAHPKVPVVAHLEDVAASGGYYLAAAADWIVAMPGTITGSIGVILLHYNLQGLVEGKLGVKVTAYRSAPQKDILSPWRDMTPAEARRLQGIVNEMHGAFLDAVLAGRRGKVTREELQGLQGTVLTAKEALARGLVDQVGYFDDAVAKAAELAGVPALRVVRYTPRPSLLEEILGTRAGARPADPWGLLGLLGRPVPCLYLWYPGL